MKEWEKNINRQFKKLRNRFFLPNFLKEMEELCIGGLSGGNKVELIVDGDDCFNQFTNAIKQAKKSINLETYIFASDEVGWKIAELLVEKSKEGIEVNVIYDAVGSIKTTSQLFTHLKKNGVEVLEYHPLIPWRKYWNITFRDHRKILVIDGQIAFVGGINISNHSAGDSFNGGNWRDTHLRIEGPAVRDIQFFFLENWYRNGGAILDNQLHFTDISTEGKLLLMVLCTKSRRKIKPINESYLSAIKHARHSIYITNAYFIPDAKIYRALVHAAERGVDVKLILPGKTDVPVVKYASRYLYKRYLKHGIKVFEYKKNILHAKTALIDDIWTTVGSSNIDRISFKKNLELNVLILDQEFGEKMEKIFEADISNSQQITLEHYQKRSILHFFIEWICYRFRNLL